MSKNPFLSDNRFQILETVNKSLDKDNHHNIKYDSKSNTFKSYDRRVNLKETMHTSIELTPELFPILGTQYQTNISQEPHNYMNFKDIVNTNRPNDIIINDTDKDNVIHGWVEIYKSNTSNEIIRNNGYSKIQTEYIEENINTSMNNIIDLMKQRWEIYKEDYDELNGEGSYDNIYTLPPIYGPEYEYDNDNDDDNDDDDDNDEDNKYGNVDWT